MNIIIDNQLSIEKTPEAAPLLKELRHFLTIDNKEKEVAKRELIDVSCLPDYLRFYSETKEEFIAPRGCFAHLYYLLEEHPSIGFYITDRTIYPNVPTNYKEITPRPYQERAIERLLRAGQGIYKAPTGSGKTITVLETISRLQTRAIILVDKLSLANQWIARCESFLGYTPGLVGDNSFQVKDITIALKQTLHSKHLSDYFYNLFGAVIYDECHHVTASTYQEIVRQFPARYLIGISATPKTEEWTFPIAKFFLGDIIWETKEEEVAEYLIKPIVKVKATNFYSKYRPSFINSRGFRVPNNYKKILHYLVNDYHRNKIIANTVLENPDTTTLLFSARLEHFDNIYNIIKRSYPHEIFFFTGSASREERDKIQKYANENHCLIFSTIADEGIDIPNLDRLIFAFPSKKESSIIQKAGRVKRRKDSKEYAEIIDISDPKVTILQNQLSSRISAYQEMGLDVFHV